MKKKIFSLLLVFAMIATLMIGCTQSQPDGNSNSPADESGDAVNEQESNTADKPVTLTIYGDSGNIQRPFMKKLFELYEEKTGNELDVQGFDAENFETVSLIKFQTGDIPDLFLHHGGYGLDAFNPAENFVDFSDAEWVSDVVDSVVPITKRKGKVYGMPFWEASYSGILYNKVIFEKLGVELPKTQDEFNAVCDKLLENDVQPIFIAVKDVWPMLYQFGMDPIFEDIDLLNNLNSNKITYAEIPQMKQMLQWYKESADKGYFGKDYNSDTWDYCMEVLGEGEAAMMYCWDTWLYSDYDSESYTYSAEDFGLMPSFTGTTEKGTFEGPNACLMLANKNGDNADEAINFINFMADPEIYNAAFDGFQTAPVFKGQNTIVPTSQYQGAAEWIQEVGRASIASPEIIGFSLVDGGKCIQELLVGNVDVDGALKLMDGERIKVAKAQQVEGF